MQMFNVEHLQEKWAPLLDYNGAEPIQDSHRRSVTAILLENQERALREEREFLSEAPTMNTDPSGSGAAGFSYGANATGPVAGFDPVLISLIRRSMPNLVAYDLAGVQPMNAPVSLIFALRSRYKGPQGPETFFNEVDTAFSGQNQGGTTGIGTDSRYGHEGSTGDNVGFGTTSQTGANPGLLAPAGSQAYTVGQGMRTAESEALGSDLTDSSTFFQEMGLSIERVSVTAKSRALKAEYSLELAQDLKAIHGLNAEAELANILSSEILAEINREMIRTIYLVAKPGAQNNVATQGIFDLDVDSNGRWSVEKFKGLIFQIERDANLIAQTTRRGKGNMVLCSADVASALSHAGILDYTPALNANMSVDDTGNTFAGVLQGKFKVYIDPYSSNNSSEQFYVAGYKGTSPYDAGIFYCPYVPLQMVRAVGEQSFQPKIGFKTRYGIVANPFAEGLDQGMGRLTLNSNNYYRRVLVRNLM
jgi:hypothetical protein